MTKAERQLLLDALEAGPDEEYRSMGAVAWMVFAFLLAIAGLALVVVR